MRKLKDSVRKEESVVGRSGDRVNEQAALYRRASVADQKPEVGIPDRPITRSPDPSIVLVAGAERC